MKKMIIPFKEKRYVIPYDGIYFLKADGRYTIINTYQGEFFLCRHLKEFEEELSGSSFIRIHNSCLVNIEKIAKVDGDQLFLQNDSGVFHFPAKT